MKYNIALLPQTKSSEVIELAEQFSELAHTYLLGNNALPHVTLSHFFAEETDIQRIWDETCRTLTVNTLHLTFAEFSYNSFRKDIYWISLLPNKTAELMKLHLIVADIIKNPVSRAYELFSPHMTLLNTTNSAAETLVDSVAANFTPIADTFILGLGETDAAGQFTRLIY